MATSRTYETVASDLAIVMRETELLNKTASNITELVTGLLTRVGAVEMSVQSIKEMLAKVATAVEGTNGQPSIKTELALLKRDVEGLKAIQQEQSMRRWQLILWALSSGGLAGGIITLLGKIL